MKKPPPLLAPRIIADMRSGDECADPDTVEKLVEDFIAEKLSKQRRVRSARDCCDAICCQDSGIALPPD